VFGETTVNIGVIAGGTRPNVVAADARADLQIRLVTEAPPVKALLERAVRDRARIDYLTAVPPLRLTTVPGFETCVVRFTTDIPHLTNWGTPAAARPRVDSGRAHRPRADLRSELAQASTLRTSGAHPLLAKGRSVKVALFGHGTMGRVLEESAARGPRDRRHYHLCQRRRRRAAPPRPQRGRRLLHARRRAGPRGSRAAAASPWSKHYRLQREEAGVRKVVEARGAALVYGANFSIGVNLFYRVVASAAQLFRAPATIRSSRRPTTPASATRLRARP